MPYAVISPLLPQSKCARVGDFERQRYFMAGKMNKIQMITIFMALGIASRLTHALIGMMYAVCAAGCRCARAPRACIAPNGSVHL